MKKIRLYSLLAASLLSGAVLSGQNLNPTIEVTNTYQRKASEISKPEQKMNIPDSLLRFDLDFDYEVFDRPYEGAYSFKPYQLDMRPGKDAWRGRKLYLKAGAGYTLRPDVDIVWSPELDGNFQMSVYASHKSYFGPYHCISAVREGDRMVLDKDGRTYKGYDSYTTAGVEGRYNWDKAIFDFEAAYTRLDAKDTILTQAFQSADFSARVRSNNDAGRYFLYDISMQGSLGFGSMDYSKALYFPRIETEEFKREAISLPEGRSYLDEKNFTMKGDVGPVFNSYSRVLVGFEIATYSYSGLFASSASRLSVNPRYQFSKKRWDINLGVVLEDRISGKVDSLNKAGLPASHRNDGWAVYPDVNVSFRIADPVSICFSATGGSDVNSYSSVLKRNHHYNPAYSMMRRGLMDFSQERVNLSLGLKGQVASRLQFELKGGVAYYQNLLMDCAYLYSPSDPSLEFLAAGYYPVADYFDPFVTYADLSLAWKSKGLAVDAGVHFRKSTFPLVDYFDGVPFTSPFELPQFSGDLRAVFNLTPRIYAGVDAEASMKRVQQGRGVVIPGYVDLGVLAGWHVSRKFGLWLEGGNLLGMTIQRTPLYAEKGPWGTVGITLSL